MKRLLLIPLVLFLACEDKKEEDNTRDLKVSIYRREINVWAFGIFINGNKVFGASECEANNPNSSECVNFTDPYLGGFRYEYEFSASKGDEVGVLAVPLNNSCYGNFACFFYVDDEIIDSRSNPCDDGPYECDCNTISFSHTID